MSVSSDPSQVPAPPAVESVAEREWRALRSRHRPTSRWGLCYQIGASLLCNGVIVWLVASGRLTPFALIVLVALEAMMLVGIYLLQSRFVPRAGRDTDRTTAGDLILGIAFTVGWLGAFYGILLIHFVPSEGEVMLALGDPWAYLSNSNLVWPLLLTLAIAFVDALQDATHFARVGGIFISTPKQQGMARTMTLFFGGIPFLVPFFGFWIGLYAVIRKLHSILTRDARRPDRNALATTLIALATVAAVWAIAEGLGILHQLLQSGVAAWALWFCASKFVSELLVISLPWIPIPARIPSKPD